jgi:Tfp pilus assembly PilM family ATPase
MNMFRREQKGWLGIDIGTASVKVAQLARNDSGIRVVATAQVPRSAPMHDELEGSVEAEWSAKGEIRTAIALGGRFRGHHAAVAMPMGFCDVHQVSNLAVGEADIDHEVREVIETITQCSADHLEFDIWPADPVNQQRWNVLAVARPCADRIYFDVVENGYTCHSIDGVPQALARSLNLSEHGEAIPPCAVLDWGYSQATFCLVVEGEPVYVRTLKDCSFQTALAEVAGELGITTDEAGVLLEKYGARGLNYKTEDEIVSMIADLVAEPVRHLTSELAKTLAHVGFQYRNFSPRQLLLFGGGALVGGLTRHLTRKLRLDTHVWSFDNQRDPKSTHDALFGVAMALSSLAWEEA